jgi:hypothetical protein
MASEVLHEGERSMARSLDFQAVNSGVIGCARGCSCSGGNRIRGRWRAASGGLGGHGSLEMAVRLDVRNLRLLMATKSLVLGWDEKSAARKAGSLCLCLGSVKSRLGKSYRQALTFRALASDYAFFLR